PSATNELIEPRPSASSTLTQDMRYFDLKVSNSGGEVIIRDFQIRPWRERPYYPDNDINHYTGEVRREPRDPFNPNRRDFIRPRLLIGTGRNTLTALVSNDEQKDLVVYLRNFEVGNGKKLGVKFLDTDSLPMSPHLCNETRWEELVHGFDMKMADEYVQH